MKKKDCAFLPAYTSVFGGYTDLRPRSTVEAGQVITGTGFGAAVN